MAEHRLTTTQDPAPGTSRFQLLPLGGSTPEELERNTADFAAWPADADLRDAAGRLREQLPARPRCRRVVLAASVQHAQRAIAEQDSRWVHTADPQPDADGVVFCFSGLGERISILGQALYDGNAQYRAVLERLGRAAAESGVRLRLDLLRTRSADSAQPAGAPTADGSARALLAAARRTTLAAAAPAAPQLAPAEEQPLRWAIGYALARTWMAAGVEPRAVLGHSLGEYVAACIAGVFSEQDALRLVSRRAELIARLPPGGMLAVSLSAAELSRRLPDGVSVSALNAPSLTVVSGNGPALATLVADLASDGVPHRYLDVPHAYHSPELGSVAGPLAEAVGQVRRDPPRLRWISSVTGRWVRPGEAADPGFWVRHTTAPVNYLGALRTALRSRPAVLLEVGPGAGLTTFANHALLAAPASTTLAVASVQPSPYWYGETTSWLSTLGRLWTSGADVDWRVLDDLVTVPSQETVNDVRES